MVLRVRGHDGAAIAQHTHTHDTTSDKQYQYKNCSCRNATKLLRDCLTPFHTHASTPTTKNIVPVVIVFNHETRELGLGHFDAHCHRARLHLPGIEVAAAIGVKELEHLARVSLDLRLGALHRPSAGDTRRPSPGRYVCVRVCSLPKRGVLSARVACFIKCVSCSLTANMTENQRKAPLFSV